MDRHICSIGIDCSMLTCDNTWR